jgi:predicted TIM-barrel fold metal-dependent hydrolase
MRAGGSAGGSRRWWLAGAGAAALGALLGRRARAAGAGPVQGGGKQDELPLSRFTPKSMLHVPETRVPRARFPTIDFHTHLGFAAKFEHGVAVSESMHFLAPPAELLPVMEHKNLRAMVNLTGGNGAGLEETLKRYDRAHPGRFISFTEPTWRRSAEPGYPRWQAEELERAHKAGARGVKVLKTLGLYLREKVTTGPLVKIDDPRFDPLWETCAALKIPVAIHVSDPEAFFLPIDPTNERYEELHAHPDWSFHGKDFPSNRALLEARDRVFARHPRTTFVALHFGNNAEDLAGVAACLDRFPHVHVDLAARIGELGRQPRTARRFFDKYQDRILFATDAVPHGDGVPQQIFGEQLYEIYFRFLETEDEYFDYAPAPVPPQGRWRIYGLGLPEPVLRKVYGENAARLLHLA